MNYLITGVSGVGKTTVAEELAKRGYEAYDMDAVPGLTRWEDDAGKPIKPPADPPKGWFNNHHWNWDIKKLKKIMTSSKKDKYFSGTASNQKGHLGLFDKVFALVIDEQQLIDRLTNRTNNPFGKHPNELADILSWHKWFENVLVEKGAIPINGTLPVDKIVSEIINDK